MSENGNALVAGGAARGIIPQSFEDAYRLARVFAATKLVPKDFQDKPEDCCVAILQGLEIGLSPIAALQSIAVINDRPCLWGDGMMAVVRASGMMEWIKEADDGITATCTVKRKGEPDPVVRTFSVEDAKRAGLNGKTGPWTQYPHRMRQMRARSWAIRDTFPDVLKGIASAEEMSDVPSMKDITPPREPLPDLPDIPDGTEADLPQTDAEFLDQFRRTLTRHAQEPGMLAEIEGHWREEIAERGLQQECADILATFEPVEKPVAATVSSTVSTQETLDIPWEQEADKSADKVASPLGAEAAATALENFRKAVAMCPNITRAKQLWKSWEETVSEFDAETQQQFGRIYDDASARIRKAVREAAE